MMRTIITIMLLLFSFLLFSQTENVNININGFDYTIVHVNKEGDCGVIKSIKLYRVNPSNGKKKFFLEHTLYERECDSNSEALELGKYIACDSCIIFYSFWCKYGDTPVSPYGARKQIYKIDEKKGLVLADSELYIEQCDFRSNSLEEWGCKGVKYLFERPQTKAEKQIFRNYIEDVQKQYNAIFVFGKKSDSLLQETRVVMKDELQTSTYYWPKGRGFMGSKK